MTEPFGYIQIIRDILCVYSLALDNVRVVLGQLSVALLVVELGCMDVHLAPPVLIVMCGTQHWSSLPLQGQILYIALPPFKQ